MRLTVILGLSHAEQTDRHIEAARILRELADGIEAHQDIEPGDEYVLRDVNGNRVGVADVFHR